MATQYDRTVLLGVSAQAGAILAAIPVMLTMPLLAASIGAMFLVMGLGMAAGYGLGLLLDKSIKQRLAEREAQAATSPARVNEKAAALAPALDNGIADTRFVDRYMQQKAAKAAALPGKSV